MQNKQNFIFQRPSQFQLPSIPENYNLSLFYNFVIPKNMIALFAAMLAERRIIFTSQRLDSLSCCVQAANALLYPMVWQHIFIPILPLTMKEILCAPMPYLIGVPKAVLETVIDSIEFTLTFTHTHSAPTFNKRILMINNFGAFR